MIKRSRPNKIGKIGRINIEANKKLKEMFEGHVRGCEVRLRECLLYYLPQFAHRHPRHWYRSKPELLHSRDQVIIACQSCHEKLDQDKQLLEGTFKRLRGDED